MAFKRKRMGRSESRRDFRRKAQNVHPKNFNATVTIRRGGIRA